MAISKYKPPGSLYLEERFNGRFFALRVWGLIFGEAYTRRVLFSEFYGIRERLLRLSILLSISSSSQGGVFIPLGFTCQLISALSYVSFLRYLHRQIFNILFCPQNLSTVSSDDVICISGVLF